MTKTYHVTITAAGLGGAAPADGFIDHMTVAQRIANGDAAPTTADEARAKERANHRFRMLVGRTTLDANIEFNDVVATGATASAPATDFQFDAVVRNDDTIANEDLTAEDALKRLVARAIMQDSDARADYTDPTETAVPAGDTNAGELGARRGETMERIEVAALTTVLATAEAAITVTEV